MTLFQKAMQYAHEGDRQAKEMVGSAQAGVNAVQSTGATIQRDLEAARQAAEGIDASITNVNAQAGLLNDQARVINAAAGDVNASADAVDREAEALKPYAEQLTNYAGQLWNEGTGIFGQGSDLVSLGNGLMNLDESQGGIIGQYVRSLKQFDPKRYVAQAAADVQGAFDNAKGQLSRELSRSGVNLSGGAALAQKRLLAQTYAATLAGAKTRAWQTGATEQLNANRTALNDAMSVLKAGIDAQTSGAGVQAQGAGLGKSAADVQGAVVTGKAQAGQLRKSAADVRSAAADAIAKAGTLYGDAGDLAAKKSAQLASVANANNGYLQALNSAYGNLTGAYKSYTEYLSTQAAGFGEWAGLGGGGGGFWSAGDNDLRH